MHAQEELGDLFSHCRDERQSQYDQPFKRRQEVGIEDRLQERHADHHNKQEDGQPNRILHVLVREDTQFENGDPL